MKELLNDINGIAKDFASINKKKMADLKPEEIAHIRFIAGAMYVIDIIKEIDEENKVKMN